jgi:hypothetical protein
MYDASVQIMLFNRSIGDLIFSILADQKRNAAREFRSGSVLLFPEESHICCLLSVIYQMNDLSSFF